VALLDLSSLAYLAIIVVPLVGLAFVGLHAMLLHQRRRDAIALEAVRILQGQATARALQVVLSLPDSCTEEQLAMRGSETEECVGLVEYNFDTLGWMVHRRMIPLRDVDDLMGGAVRAVWRRVHLLAEERRHTRGTPNDFEWTQWLAERLEENPSPAKQSGAHNFYRRWRP